MSATTYDLTKEAQELYYWRKGGDSFSCLLYTMFQKADYENRWKLANAFPRHWAALQEWNNAGNYGWDFFKRYGISTEGLMDV